MSFTDKEEAEQAQRIANRFLDGTSLGITESRLDFDPAIADPEAAADRVAEYWISAPKSLIMACVYLVAALNAFAGNTEKVDAFLLRLVSKRMLSENDVLARLKANGKLAMLRKIGQHADTLLQPSVLRLLTAYYSIIYQICLLIEEVGPDRAVSELSTRPDATRDDVAKVRAALAAQDTESEPVPAIPSLDKNRAQVFALKLIAQDWRLFAKDYVQFDTLDRCLRRPQPADDAGLVAIVPIMMLGSFERALLPLLGFSVPDKLFMESSVGRPEITDRDVIVVARRGDFRPQPLNVFPADSGRHDVLSLAELFFPDTTVKCQLFAQRRADGWMTFVDDENWNERPSVR
jgi:hypothetical protein